MTQALLKQRVREGLSRLGFSLVRFTVPPLGEAGERFKRWLARGFAGEMAYLQGRQQERLEPSRLLPGIQSILVMAFPYDCGQENTVDPGEGNISRYAWGGDYHELIGKKLKTFIRWMNQVHPGSRFYASVDAQPVLEKAWADKAGLGWLGKHSNIISAEQGSYLFLATLLSDVPFEPDPPQQDHCGTCTRCMEVCPTQAIVAPYVLDASRCISYLTIELKGAIPKAFRPHIGNRIFGCDDCQEVCPWNRFSRLSKEAGFAPRPELRNQPLEKWLRLDPESFRRLFKDSPLSRPKYKGFLRNVLVAAGNSGKVELIALVKEKLGDKEALIRGHAVWAYYKLSGKDSRSVLEELRKQEKDPFVLEELEEALSP